MDRGERIQQVEFEREADGAKALTAAAPRIEAAE
jgi:hypothetical protein